MRSTPRFESVVMDLSRRRTIQAIGAAGGLTATTGTVLASGEHADDERSGGDDHGGGSTADQPMGAAVRIAHFSPDAPNVDVYVGGNRVLADVPYGAVSPYLELEPGTYPVEIMAAGDRETVAFEGDVEVGSAFYTVSAIGELGAGTFEPLVTVDADRAFVRLAHASPDAPAVDVYADGGDAPLFEDVAFGETTNYVGVAAGTYALDVRPAGGDDAVASFDVTLEGNASYTGYAIGYLEPGDADDRAFTVQLTKDGMEGGADE